MAVARTEGTAGGREEHSLGRGRSKGVIRAELLGGAGLGRARGGASGLLQSPPDHADPAAPRASARPRPPGLRPVPPIGGVRALGAATPLRRRRPRRAAGAATPSAGSVVPAAAAAVAAAAAAAAGRRLARPRARALGPPASPGRVAVALAQ